MDHLTDSGKDRACGGTAAMPMVFNFPSDAILLVGKNKQNVGSGMKLGRRCVPNGELATTHKEFDIL
jgi:hypothetical protein